MSVLYDVIHSVRCVRESAASPVAERPPEEGGRSREGGDGFRQEGRSRVPPTRWSRSVRGFVAKAAGEGEAVSARNTFARVLNDCFGVSMPERWRAARKQVNPSENATVPERPRSCHASQPRRMPPPVARKNTPRSVSAGLPRSSARRFVGQPDAAADAPPRRAAGNPPLAARTASSGSPYAFTRTSSRQIAQ